MRLALVLGAILVAGCAKPADPVGTASTEGLVEPALSAWRISWTGSLGGHVGACTTQCDRLNVLAADYAFMTEAAGLVDADLTLAWESVSPSTRTLDFGIAACEPGCPDGFEGAEFATGPSPLDFELRGFEIPAGKELWVWAFPPGAVSGRPTAWVAADEEIQVQGEIRTAT